MSNVIPPRLLELARLDPRYQAIVDAKLAGTPLSALPVATERLACPYFTSGAECGCLGQCSRPDRPLEVTRRYCKQCLALTPISHELA